MIPASFAGSARPNAPRSSYASGAGGWASGGDTPLPAAAVPSGAAAPAVSGAAAPAGRGGAAFGRVQFDVAPSPALTPSWKSTSWNRPEKKAGGGRGGPVERSPDLRPEGEFAGGVKEGSETVMACGSKLSLSSAGIFA